MPDPEVLPPEEKALSHTPLSPQDKKIVRVLGVGAIISGVLWCVNEFTSIRAVNSVLASRILLVVIWVLLAMLGMVVLWGLRLKWRLPGFFGWIVFWGLVLIAADRITPRPPTPPTADYIKHHTPVCWGLFFFDPSTNTMNVSLSNPSVIPISNARVCAGMVGMPGPPICRDVPTVYPDEQQVPYGPNISLPAKDGMYSVRVDSQIGSTMSWIDVRIQPFQYGYQVWDVVHHKKILDNTHTYWEMN